MKERPILFRGEMVRAILDGRKSQTRRVMKPQPPPYQPGPLKHPAKHPAPYLDAYNKGPFWCWWSRDDRQGPGWIRNRFGSVGDHLWVRETWFPDPPIDSTWASTEWSGCGRPIAGVVEHYRGPRYCLYKEGWDGVDLTWKPSLHMPRWASRITLEVTGVRVERLQDISEEDAIAEGITGPHSVGGPAFHMPGDSKARYSRASAAFEDLWDSINAKSHPWASTPWVWVISFERVEAAEKAA